MFNNLTMNSTAASGADSNGTYSVSDSAAVTFNGSITSNPGVSINGTFPTASGPISGTATIPGTTGLARAKRWPPGTPVLPSLNVPYTATVLQQRQLSPATGTTASPITLPAATGGLLYGAEVPINVYSVMSTSY